MAELLMHQEWTSNYPDLGYAVVIKSMDDIVKTMVQDAIHCTVNPGESYLWVDALYIIQDSMGHKRIQIAQMDRIYGAAILTLIAAPSVTSEACSGLPRYHENSGNTCRDTELVQGLHLAVPLNAIQVATMSSRWDYRAQTYQENLLSR